MGHALSVLTVVQQAVAVSNSNEKGMQEVRYDQDVYRDNEKGEKSTDVAL